MAIDFLSDEAQGINYLHSLEHLQNCLFFAEIDLASDSKFRISRVSLNTPSLTFEKNNNRFMTLTGASLPDEVTITWIEDAYRSVEQYHARWLNDWYDFKADFIRLGCASKFRNIRIMAYHYVNKNNSISAPIMDADPLITIELSNCVPTNMGSSMDFDWSQGGIKEFTTTYKFAKCARIGYIAPKQAITSNQNWEDGSLYNRYSTRCLGGAYDPVTVTRAKAEWAPDGTLIADAGTRPEEAWAGIGSEVGLPISYTTVPDVDKKARAEEDLANASLSKDDSATSAANEVPNNGL